jgi:hypothetical protein
MKQQNPNKQNRARYEAYLNEELSKLTEQEAIEKYESLFKNRGSFMVSFYRHRLGSQIRKSDNQTFEKGYAEWMK